MSLPILLRNWSAAVIKEAKRAEVQSAADDVIGCSAYGAGGRGDGIRGAIIIAIVVGVAMALVIGVVPNVLVIDGGWNELIAHDDILPRVVTRLLREGS